MPAGLAGVVVASVLPVAGCGSSGSSQQADTQPTTVQSRADRLQADLRVYKAFVRAGKEHSAAESRTCPFNRANGFRTQRLVGMSVSDATALAKKNGCFIRVVRRNGQNLTTTADLSLVRIDVAVRRGLVSQIVEVA